MSERLNVLLVVLDGVRADHLSCYGYPRGTTPFLDRLGREGVRFPHTYSTGSWTLPAHASLLTGLFPSSHGATDESRYLASRHETIPQVLERAGYRTAAFCTNPWMSPGAGFGRGFQRFVTQAPANPVLARPVLAWRALVDRMRRRADAGARRTNRVLLDWLGAGSEPFFAFVHYNEPHLPVRVPPKAERVFTAAPRARIRALHRACTAALSARTAAAADDGVVLTALYDGALRYVDAKLQEVAEALAARGQWDRTLCIVTADHGENLGELGQIGHRFGLRDALLHVPLLIRCPSAVPQGYVIDEFAQLVDVLPTITHLTGLDDATSGQGRPLIRDGRPTPGPAFAIAERFRPNLAAIAKRFPSLDLRPYDVRQKAIRTKREKYVWRSDEDNEFYDLVVDPSETQNRIRDEPARADALRKQLFDWLASVDRFAVEGEQPEMDAGMRRQLQSLGYID